MVILLTQFLVTRLVYCLHFR